MPPTLGSKTATVPEDLAVAMAASPAAAKFFATLYSTETVLSILYRGQRAQDTRNPGARMQKFVEMLAQHQNIHA